MDAEHGSGRFPAAAVMRVIAAGAAAVAVAGTAVAYWHIFGIVSSRYHRVTGLWSLFPLLLATLQTLATAATVTWAFAHFRKSPQLGWKSLRLMAGMFLAITLAINAAMIAQFSHQEFRKLNRPPGLILQGGAKF